jgi:polynucleotide 5'-hydroxyl-kinase GRC3/NOL9
MACALDLMRHYRRLLERNPTCPLVVNCSGWVYGSGLEVLTELILKLGITDVVYMSEGGPPEVVEELVSATKTACVPFTCLHNPQSVTRSASDLSVMSKLLPSRTVCKWAYGLGPQTYHHYGTVDGTLCWSESRHRGYYGPG